MNYDEIGKFISNQRKEKGLTQKSLAEKLKITDKAVSKWERGLGCPDVSILENLSNILDISILEILKGRKIDKDELKNYNNDYIIDTINYSQYEIENKYKKLVSNILSIIIIVIIGYLVILNVYHISYLKKEETYNFSSNTYLKDAKNTLNKIENNIDTIEKLKLKFTKQENEQLLNAIKEQYNFFKNYSILQYQGKVNFNINDLYILDYYSSTSMNINLYLAYEILEKYDSKFKGYKEHYFIGLLAKSYGNMNFQSEISNTYKYRINIVNDSNYINKIESNIEFRIFETVYNIEELYILTDNIIKVGNQNE